MQEKYTPKATGTPSAGLSERDGRLGDGRITGVFHRARQHAVRTIRSCPSDVDFRRVGRFLRPAVRRRACGGHGISR